MENFEKVVIVDDNEIDALVCTRILKKNQLSTQVTRYEDASKALSFIREAAETHPEDLPDLILLDLYMPFQNGWFFLDEYRKIVRKTSKKITLLVTTVSDFKRDLAHIKEYKEIDGYIHKPFTLDKLSSSIAPASV